MKNEKKGFYHGLGPMNTGVDMESQFDVSKDGDDGVRLPKEVIVYRDLIEKGAKTYEFAVKDGVVHVAVLGEENSSGSFVRSNKVLEGKYYISVTSNPRVIEQLIARLNATKISKALIPAASFSTIILAHYNGAINYAEWRSKGV